jgi:CRISPR-associated protein Csh1
MIREIINFVEYLEVDFPEAFTFGKKPSEGIHIFVEIDENGKWKNNEPIYQVDFDFFEGKSELTPLLQNALLYEEYGERIGTSMNKVLDKKKQIFTCSPYIVGFKKQSTKNDKLEGKGFDKITNLLNFYFDTAISTCIEKEDESSIQKVKAFKTILPDVLNLINKLTIIKQSKDGEKHVEIFNEMKDLSFVIIYLINIPIEKYKEAQKNYLKQKLFNSNDYNSEKIISNETFGLSNFINGANSKKMFLMHKTATMYQGVSTRIQAKDTVALNKFENLLGNQAIPNNPIPIFIDKEEFHNQKDIISIFNKDNRKPSYSQILKELYDMDEQRVLANYYLLNIRGNVVRDFDFVSSFQFKLKNCVVKNLFRLKQGENLLQEYAIKNIFDFEHFIVVRIFNNSLVKLNLKEEKYSYNYFDEIDSNYVSGKEPMFLLIMKYRKAFYDFIYKSKRESLSSLIIDDILLKSILIDLRNDEIRDRHHTKEYSIKEKLNIWFSLYNYFDNQTNLNRIDMATKFEELLVKTREIANNDNIHLSEDPAEFLFVTGQIIYFLLTKSAASNKTHALLEPFLQKVKVNQLQTSITNAVGTYKHEIEFSKGRFERLAAQVLAYNKEINLKEYQHFMLAGYFAPCMIYEKGNN